MALKTHSSELEGLCLECGLCCNGALFAGVRLEPEDDRELLASLGLPIVAKSGGARFQQPCAALKGCRCGIYRNRPDYCRRFECLLFMRVRQGEVAPAKALALVRKARAALARVEKLLAKLGTDDRSLPLRRRFQRRAKALETGGATPEQAESFSQLTLACHRLNLLLQEHFHP